jgi:hypothetical protein
MNVTINAQINSYWIQEELEEIFLQDYYNDIHSLFLLLKLLMIAHYDLKYFYKNYRYNRKKLDQLLYKMILVWNVSKINI